MIKYKGKKFLDEGYNNISIRNRGTAGVITVKKTEPESYPTIKTEKITKELDNTINDIKLIIESFIHSGIIKSVKYIDNGENSYDLITLINDKSLKLNCDQNIKESYKALEIKSMCDILLLLKTSLKKYSDYTIWLKITERENAININQEDNQIIISCSNRFPKLLEQILKILMIEDKLEVYNAKSIIDMNAPDQKLIVLVSKLNMEFYNEILAKVKQQKQNEEEMKLSLQKRQLKMEE